MRELIGQLSRVDEDAASALRVIARFDALVEGHASLASLVRAASALASLPAGLHEAASGRQTRVAVDGAPLPAVDLDPSWPSRSLTEGRGTVVWIETSAPLTPVVALVLERYAAAVHLALDRNRNRLSYADAVRRCRPVRGRGRTRGGRPAALPDGAGDGAGAEPGRP